MLLRRSLPVQLGPDSSRREPIRFMDQTCKDNMKLPPEHHGLSRLPIGEIHEQRIDPVPHLTGCEKPISHPVFHDRGCKHLNLHRPDSRELDEVDLSKDASVPVEIR
jgi:hypothetical protein